MRIYFTLLLSFFISSCSINQKKPQLNPALNSSENSIKKFVDWKIHGRISIKTPDETNIISIRWQQNKENLKLRLYGSMGKTYARLIKKDGIATLSIEDKSYTNTNARYLLWSVLGWDLPIDEMQYWIKGITHPSHLEKNIIRDNQSHISSFDYNKWHAVFEKYKKFKSYQLPTKLILTHPKIRIRFSIQSWNNAN